MAAGRARLGTQLWTGAQLVMVLSATAMVAVWGVLLVYLRVGGRTVPISLVLALAVVPLCRQGGALLGRRVGVVLPAVLWLGIVLVLGAGRAEGDRLVGGDSVVGLLFLVLGTLAASVTVGAWRPGHDETSLHDPGSRHVKGDPG